MVIDNKNISVEMVKEGLIATRLFTQETKYRNLIIQVEQSAKINQVGCQWLVNAGNFLMDLPYSDR